MTGDRLRVGFVGAGRIADLHALGWLEDARGELAAVAEPDPQVRARRAEAWGCATFESLDRMLAADVVDAVEVLTPHHLHEEQALAVLAAGKHLSLQKPPTVGLAGFDRVATAATAAGVTFRVHENFTYYPPHVKARELVDAGAVGEVLSVRVLTAGGRLDGQGWEVPDAANAWRMDRRRCGGGMMTFDHGFHCFHMGRHFVSAPVEEVHAFIHVVDLGDGTEIDVPALVSWRHQAAQGAMPALGSWELVPSIDLDVRSDYYVSDDRMEIRGTSGVLWVTRCTGQLLEEPALTLYCDGEVRQFHHLRTDWADSFRGATAAFIDAVLDGGPCPLTAADARATLAFALAAQRSAREGRRVPIDEMG